MRKHFLLMFSAVLCVSAISCQEEVQWAPVGENIMTPWAEEVSVANAHPEYPRPQMVRNDWKNLNGLWEYAITAADYEQYPGAEGHILVPYPIESALSGVGKRITPKDALWYRTEFKVPGNWKGKQVILHFDAVDYNTKVYLNGQYVGSHVGGYTAFEFDVTQFVGKGAQELVLKVVDGTDNDLQPRGKQILNPSGIWYTAVTGIWQSVWMEPVPAAHIVDWNAVSDIDAGTVTVDVDAAAADGTTVKVELLEGAVGYSTENPSTNVIASAEAPAGQSVTVTVPEVKTWSPDSPYLYGMKISLVKDGKAVDAVQAYTGMRKISVVTDEAGYKRIGMNGKPLFHYGPLDQGWWPDGLYTAPTDEALKFDLVQTKEYGFNMIRKHIKVEPARWFYYCDQLGITVWQDMPSYADNRKGQWNTKEYDNFKDWPVSDVAREAYYTQWKDIINQVKKYPCVSVWVPFNEAWGQFETAEAVAYTRELDPTRLINMSSGGNWVSGGVGDILDFHHYPAPHMAFFDPEMINLVGEYGGIGLPVEGHLWQSDKNWGYVKFGSSDEVTDKYVEFAEILKGMVAEGCSGAVYTQTTDVEGEVNGLMTYDRKVFKLDKARVNAANTAVINELK